jgi:hypothetical protein
MIGTPRGHAFTRDDAAHPLDTSSIACEKDKRAHGGYRTGRVILEVCEAVPGAGGTGRRFASDGRRAGPANR